MNYGSNQTFTITPNTRYHVVNVLVDGSSVGAVTTYTFSNITANHTISATFSNTYNLTVTKAGQAVVLSKARLPGLIVAPDAPMLTIMVLL